MEWIVDIYENIFYSNFILYKLNINIKEDINIYIIIKYNGN